MCVYVRETASESKENFKRFFKGNITYVSYMILEKLDNWEIVHRRKLVED